MVCLCSGNSGESVVMREETDRWVVYRIDSDRAVCDANPGTLHHDVTKWLDWIERYLGFGKVELVWASPPCTQFSTARAELIEHPSMEILEACMDIIDHLNPTWWIIENVRGAVRHFEKPLGPPTQVIGPFYLWGKFPHLNIVSRYKGSVKTRINRNLVVDTGGDGHWTFNDIRYNKWDTPNRAEIPRVISQELFNAVETQRTLGDF